MGIFDRQLKRDSGMTIVELIVVVSVIGILASIVLVAYPAYQQRTRDNERKSDVNQLATALGAYAFQKNTFVTTASGCGRNGNGNGWLSAGSAHPGAGTYPRSIVECLQDIKALPTGTFTDPSTCVYDSGGACGTYRGNPVKAYMKATCTKSSNPVTYLFAYLELLPRKDSEVDALCDSGTVSGFDATSQLWGTNYGMNYYMVVK
jgi:prepilin-type N-terminal cleavage/methylation domain-containing protein